VTASGWSANPNGTPTLTSLSASSGIAAGGESITITGTNFNNVQAVCVGDTIATQWTVNSTTSITVVAPPATPGTNDIQAVTSVGPTAVSSSSRYPYNARPAPAVASLSSSGGSGAGGTVVTLTGTWLAATQSVHFGDVPATFSQTSDTQLVAVAPPHAIG